MKVNINQYIKWGVWVYILLGLSIVSIINLGLFSYNKISDSLNNLNSRINQDVELTSIKDIRLTYIKMDNTMEMYLITNKMFYLNQFDTLAMKTKKIITELNKSKKITPSESELVDSLENIIRQKLENLDYIVLFEQNLSIENSIKDLLERPSNSVPENSQSPQTKKKSFAERIGLKRKKQMLDSVEKSSSTHGSRNNSSEDILIKKQDLFDIRQSSASINPFLENDKVLNDYFMDICRILENIETDRLDQGRVVSEKKIQEANKSILLLGISTALFILLAAIVYFRYVKRLGEVRKSLANAKELAEEMAMLKEKFMANMSHEIRTPMNAISGFVDQLHASTLTIKQKKQIEIIQRSITHVLNIINDILDFSKLNAGKLTLDYKGFEIEKVVTQTIDILQPLSAAKKLAISCTIDEEIPSILIGDAYRLRQILLNIIGNAIKYTNEGSIDINVNSQTLGDNVFSVEIIVKDTGIGIEKTELENIFKEYHMTDNKSWNKAGSSGLGLSITKMLVELHQGTIAVSSTINYGTCVSIKIPFNGGTSMDIKRENKYLTNLDFLVNKRILIADDEPFNRVLLNNILQKYNAIAVDAENGREVLSLLEKSHFDCILMDIKMPDINGLEASEKIRKSENHLIAGIPIIAVSAALTTENFTFLQGIGVDAFLEKPFKENELLNLLYKVLDVSPTGPSIATDIMPENPNAPKEIFDLGELQKQSRNDPNFVNDMLDTLIQSTQKGIIEIEAAIKEEQWESINMAAHRIASPLKFIHASELYEIIKQIELDTEPEGDKNLEIINQQFNSFREKFATLEQLIREFIKK